MPSVYLWPLQGISQRHHRSKIAVVVISKNLRNMLIKVIINVLMAQSGTKMCPKLYGIYRGSTPLKNIKNREFTT